MTAETKSAELQAAEAKWYEAEQLLQEAARKATAEFLTDGERTGHKRGFAGRTLQVAAEDFAAAHTAVRAVLAKEAQR